LQNRQAGAAIAAVLAEESKSAALCFSSQKDAIDYANRLVEDAQAQFAARNLSIVKAYIEGRVHAVFPLHSLSGHSEYQLVFSAIPMKVSGLNWGLAGRWDDCEISGATDPNREKVGVGCVTQLVYSPEGIIPSFVRLERAKERHDRIGDIGADLTSFDEIFEFIGAVRDGELRALKPRAAGNLGSGVARSIQGRTKREKNLASEVIADRRQSPLKSEYMKLIGNVRVFLNDDAIWGLLHERVDVPVKLGAPFSRVQKRAFGAIEGVGTRESHGKARSNKRSRVSEGGEAFSDHATETA
jgi:hypothetical protein